MKMATTTTVVPFLFKQPPVMPIHAVYVGSEKPRGCKFSHIQIKLLKEWLRTGNDNLLEHLTFKRIVAYKKEKRSVNIGRVVHALMDIGYTLEEIQNKSAREIAEEVVHRTHGSFDDDDDNSSSSSSEDNAVL
jgi:hypothetical protein